MLNGSHGRTFRPLVVIDWLPGLFRKQNGLLAAGAIDEDLGGGNTLILRFGRPTAASSISVPGRTTPPPR